mmetsp:Transcript_28707/g.80809  ORF Transcript_28707/g.80809 Transcript_28707/m.80809 type:complete len:165 (+) Transcript_28707:299-793(+)|eukprot:CAMPEP_0117682272 /NCGR_PEP_ID=MMETSP0804-20121206/19546_1 /TAXON_ID=1074897 /ORGANISM="Tetraselmis astigmatica, Strain CCMP880" /LENGTH=164 /DNA_ID=CAMNT_0005492323 /DNA_START=198 /DNA_END=692 /DNA_ORIENTATION=-
MGDSSVPSSTDLEWLRYAIDLSKKSKEGGNHPFGAVLVGDDGKILLEAMNTCNTKADSTGHAERNLMTSASKSLSALVLSKSCMYTSAEPCAMCTGAAYWTGVGRIVYGLSERRLLAIIGPHPDNLCLDMPCRNILSTGQREIEVVGPLLEDEAAEPHIGFWTT